MINYKGIHKGRYVYLLAVFYGNPSSMPNQEYSSTNELSLTRYRSLPVDIRAAGLPQAIEELGPDATYAFIDFFISNIRNKNTRAAYSRAVWRFFKECSLPLAEISSMHVAVHIETLGSELAAPSVKQHLAAIRMLFDWLVVKQIMPQNPAQSVRGPKHVVKKGKTPILYADEVRQLFESIDTSTDSGKRDKAFIATLFYTFARVSAVCKMTKADVFTQKRRQWVRLAEKGGKQHEMPCHHLLEEYLQDYLENSQISEFSDASTPLFCSIEKGRNGYFTGKPLTRQVAYKLVRRRLRQANIPTKAGNHMFRASGITIYLENGGQVENAQQMASHESPRTTKLYDRRSDDISLDEVEKIII